MGKTELTRLSGVQEAQGDPLLHQFHEPAGRLWTTGGHDIDREVHSDRGGDGHGVAAARRELLKPASDEVPDACGDTGEQPSVLLSPGKAPLPVQRLSQLPHEERHAPGGVVN